MTFSGNDAQTTQRLDRLMVFCPLGTNRFNSLLLLHRVQRHIGIHRFQSLTDVATQHNVGPATRHIGGDGDHFGASGLCHDIGFARMLLGIEHLMR